VDSARTAKTLAASTLAALLISSCVRTCAIAAASPLPDAQQPSAAAQPANTPSTVCQKNKQAVPPDETIKRWCDQWDTYDAQGKSLQDLIDKFPKDMGTVVGIGSSGPAFSLQKAYIDSIAKQKADVDAIVDKLQEIIDVYAILPYLGDQKVGAAQQLASLQVDLSSAIAKYQSDKRTTISATPVKPPAASNSNTDTTQHKPASDQAKAPNQDPAPSPQQPPAKAPANADAAPPNPAPDQAKAPDQKPAPSQDQAQAQPQTNTDTTPPAKTTKPWGPLTGQVLEDKTAKPIAGAIIVAQCGTDGSNKVTTWTDDNGQYFLSSLPDQPCLIRAAKTLSPDEFEDAQSDLEKNFNVLTKNSKLNNISLSASQVEKKTISSLPPKDWAYEERSLASVGPGTQANGQPVVAADIFLSRRTSTVGEFARTIVGFQQSGTTSADSLQRFFFDLWLSIPAPFINDNSLKRTVPKLPDPNFGPRYRLWGDVRVTTVPQQITNSVGDFALGFAANVA
jgi:hypothetical protein